MHFSTPACLLATGLLLLTTTVFAAPTEKDLDPELYYFENTRDENGYSFSFRTKDGQFRKEQGVIHPETGVLTVTGMYGFVGIDGQAYEYNYVADEEGYRIVPKPPEIGFSPISNAALLSLVG